MTLLPLETLLIAALVLLLGRVVNRLVPWLSHYNIPAPITGGLLFAVGVLCVRQFSPVEVVFDSTLKPVLLLAFFAAVGLSANLSLLKQGGKRLLLFVLVLIPFLILQNFTGLLIAWGLDMHPLMGLVGGSITLVGGHGTGAAYAERFAEVNNIQSIMELAMTAATLGLVLGGICGGPLAQWLIKRHNLASAEIQPYTPQHPQEGQANAPITASNLIPVLAAVLIALIAGRWLGDLVSGGPVTLPSFLWCLLVGVLIRNAGHHVGLRLNDAGINMLSSLTLALFLAITMMTLNLASVASLAGPLIVILLGQLLLVVVYGGWLVYRAVGRDYESAVMSAAFCGFAMGATATAIANMQAITQKYGPAPQAFLVVPLVGAFLIDLLNALVLTGYLSLPWIGG